MFYYKKYINYFTYTLWLTNSANALLLISLVVMMGPRSRTITGHSLSKNYRRIMKGTRRECVNKVIKTMPISR